MIEIIQSFYRNSIELHNKYSTSDSRNYIGKPSKIFKRGTFIFVEIYIFRKFSIRNAREIFTNKIIQKYIYTNIYFYKNIFNISRLGQDDHVRLG